MNENKKNFWSEALKGGTIIGLVSVAFALLSHTFKEQTTLAQVVDIASTVIGILLAAGFLRKFAAGHTKQCGFSYGRGVGFVVAMMIFAGVLTGVYSAVMANFFIREELLQVVEQSMAQMQDMIPADSFEQTYSMMQKSVTSPLILTLSSVVSNAFYGLLCGLILSLITRRQPDIFADDSTSEQA